MNIGLRAARDANQVDFLAPDPLDVLTVHRVNIKNQVNMILVIIVRLGNINHIQQNNRVQLALTNYHH